MSLAAAMPPSRMTNQELAAEASKLRRRPFLSPGEEDRLASLAAEMNNRGMGKR